MALSANTVWEVRVAGSDTNGGGFVTGSGGTDYSQQNGVNPNGGSNGSSVLAAAAGTTTITCTDAQFTSAITGNIVYFQGGSGSIAAQWRQATYVSATTITIDTAIATSTGMTMNVGGALQTVGQLSALLTIGGMIAYLLQAGSVFPITSITTSVPGGSLGMSQNIFIQGYTTTRSLGNSDTAPTIQAQITGATFFSGSSGWVIQNIICDGNTPTYNSRVANSGSGVFILCTFKNFATASNNIFTAIKCYATTNSAAVFSGTAISCVAYNNTATQFVPGQAGILIDCISYSNTGAGTDGFSITINAGLCKNCVAYSNGRHGFNLSGGTSGLVINCHAENNNSDGFLISNNLKVLINCSVYNNGTNFAIAGNNSNTGSITITVGSVFVNAASGNFLLNSTTSQGASLRAGADPSSFPGGLTSNYRDIGAAQHQDSGSGGGVIFLFDS